ncbi:MAG: hypothetical protein P5690_26390, partial [Limnospira sp. PMC 1236.20]|uniref:hypothetical protein n=1 Tax=Limnospira sp. PMC 1236.20 TaxID=2981034 RepID=UPI0028E1387C
LMLVMDISDRKRSEQQVNRALAKARAYADQLQVLASLFVRIGALKNVQDLLQVVVDEGRQLIGAHQAAISVLEDGKWDSA